MNELRRYIGGRLIYWGYRLLPLRTRRGVSLLCAVGIEWTDANDDLVSRIMRGERIGIEVRFQTEEYELPE